MAFKVKNKRTIIDDFDKFYDEYSKKVIGRYAPDTPQDRASATLLFLAQKNLRKVR